MGEVIVKNTYLDFEGLKKYDSLIKNFIASGNGDLANAIAALDAKLGDMDVEGSDSKTVSEKINEIYSALADIAEKHESLDSKDEELKGLIDGIVGDLDSLEGSDSDVVMTLVEITNKLKTLDASVLKNTQDIVGVTERVAAVEEAIKDLGEIEGGENLGSIVLPRLDISKNTSVGRFADSVNRIKYAFENIDCEEAIIYWDDTYALNPFTYEDCKHSKYVKKDISKYKRGDVWGDGVCNAIECIEHFGKKCEKNYCSHVPFVFNKINFLNMIYGFDFLKNPYNMDLAYFNIFKQEDEIFVPWRCSKENPDKCIYKKEVRTKMNLEDGILNAKWSTIDIPLINFNLFDVLDRIYFSNQKSENNINSKMSKISDNTYLQKLREGIKNGTIVKEYKSDGTYIWKKIRK